MAPGDPSIHKLVVVHCLGQVCLAFMASQPTPVGKWLVTPIYKPWNAHLEGEQPYLGDLLTMVINCLLNEMILQVPPPRNEGLIRPY